MMHELVVRSEVKHDQGSRCEREATVLFRTFRLDRSSSCETGPGVPRFRNNRPPAAQSGQLRKTTFLCLLSGPHGVDRGAQEYVLSGVAACAGEGGLLLRGGERNAGSLEGPPRRSGSPGDSIEVARRLSILIQRLKERAVSQASPSHEACGVVLVTN